MYYVIKFLNVTNKEAQQRKVVSFAQLNNLTTPPNSPNSATSNPNKLYQCKLQSAGITGVPIKEERESSPESKSDKTKPSVESIQKDLIEAVITSTRHLVNNFSSEQISNTSKIALNTLCPALYALLNEGLKPNLSTSFGDTPNSVWQVIEGSAQLGPSTKSLHELVLRLNSEQVLLSEGLLKFNAFLFGLLNVRGLDTWLSFLRTRETLLRRHYSESAILVSGCRGNATAKTLIDLLIGALGPLNSLPFKLDLLYEVRSLHESLSLLGKLPPISPIHSVSSSIGSLRTSWTLKKLIRSIQSSSEEESELTMGHIRPRSCIDSANYLSNDVASSAKKRWSTINMGSKLAVAFQSLGGEEDEYPDSLEPEPPVPPTSTTTTPPTLENKRLTAVTSDDNTSSDLSDLPDLSYTSEATSSGTRGGKFKRLQQRWEMLSGTPLQTPASSPVKVRSRIPRPVSSPTTVVKPSGLPLAKPMAKKPPLPSPTSTTPKSITPAPPRSKTEVLPSKMSLPKTEVLPSKITLPKSDLVTLPSKMSVPRTSRVDSVVSNPRPPVTRPSSLPYRKAVVGVERRAVSSSVVNRSVPQPQPPKYVKTLSHRLPSDNGHLSYNSGERLKVVLEVDDKWLLCCRGRQKGLVPRSAVILY
ncbi:hypothetical protein M8J77_001490 [Diaphorina citri]|nr:hypothetical protein M8J77_001490 [Diaphorina citri]